MSEGATLLRFLLVLLLGGDFGNFEVMLRPAGLSEKNHRKCRDVSVRPVEFLVLGEGGPPTHL